MLTLKAGIADKIEKACDWSSKEGTAACYYTLVDENGKTLMSLGRHADIKGSYGSASAARSGMKSCMVHEIATLDEAVERYEKLTKTACDKHAQAEYALMQDDTPQNRDKEFDTDATMKSMIYRLTQMKAALNWVVQHWTNA